MARAASRARSRSPPQRATPPSAPTPAPDCHDRRSPRPPRSSRPDSALSRRPAATDERRRDAPVSATAALPAAQHRAELLQALERHAVVVCVGETGSGKTTQLPQYLLRAFEAEEAVTPARTERPRMVAVTQPRRVAAVSVAQRVAEELGEPCAGRGRVGYAVRFDDRSGPRTRIKFVTDGVLVRECLADPRLRRYRAVMLDEAHERSIHTDVLLGLLRRLVRSGDRPDLRVLVTSATLDADRFAAFFSAPGGRPCPVVRIPGRAFPVDILHARQRQIMGPRGPLAADYARAAVETAMQVHNSEPAGHVLVFLTGQREVEAACADLRRLDRQQRRDGGSAGSTPGGSRLKMRVLPLYGALSAARQREVFAPAPADTRKVVVATNVAETSLTIDGVRFVVDCGFVKQKAYDPARRVEALVVVPVSKVAAQQRAGRAGRTAPGKCFRLYDRESYVRMMQETVPEIQRTNLANTVLQLKLLGVRDVLGFDYLDPPGEDALLDALEQLVLLGALDRGSGAPTPVGRLMAAFPLEPQAARALVEALARGRCGREMAAVVAMLSTESVFAEPARRPRAGTASDEDADERGEGEPVMAALRRDGLLDDSGDHLTLLHLLAAFERVARADEAERWCEARQLRPRALRLALAIRDQLNDIADALSPRDLERVADGPAAGEAKASADREPSLSARLRRSLCAGFFLNAARQCTLPSVYRTLRPRAEAADRGSKRALAEAFYGEQAKDAGCSQLARLHPQSALQLAPPPALCVFHELAAVGGAFLRHVSAVDASWLARYAAPPVSRLTLRRVCGHHVAEDGGEEEEQKAPEEARDVGDKDPSPKDQKTRVAPDAVAAARARFLARKQQRRR